MNLKEILEFYGLDTTKRIKVVRHKDDSRGHDIQYLYEINQFDTYQSYQSKADFHECDYIVSFIGLENQLGVFVGVYKVKSFIKEAQFPLPETFHYYATYKPTRKWYYDLEKIDQFIELEDRLIITWSGSMRAWAQWLDTSEKEVFQILPKGRVAHFPGYLDFILTYSELKSIIRHPEVNKDWYQTLSQVSGIYMILDKSNGKQYIGSASGEKGIWGRFNNYAEKGHGGNKELLEILNNKPSHINHLRFTLLETLPLSMTKREILKREDLYKKKLGTRIHGMNNN